MVEGTSIDHGDALLAVANRYGISGGLRIVTVAGAAEAAGVSRATIYRHWPTVTELNADLVVDVACHPSAWQRRILAVDPAMPLSDAVEEALAGRPPDRGAILRGGARERHEPTRASVRIRDWERAWLDVFATWVDRHLAAHGLEPIAGVGPAVVALAVATAIEGQLLQAELRRSDQPTCVGPVERRLAALAAQAAVAGLTEPAGNAAGPARPDQAPLVAPPTGLTTGQRAILAPIQDQIAEQYRSGEPTLVFNRVLDIGLIARHLGITTRTATNRWPTASTLNAELVAVATGRDRIALTSAFHSLFASVMQRPVALSTVEFVAALDAIVRWGRTDDHTLSSIDLGLLCFDPDVVSVAAGQLEVLLDDARVILLALLAAGGDSIRFDLTTDDFTLLCVGGLLGALRIVKTHHDLFAWTVEPDANHGHPVTALTFGLAAGILQLLEH